MSRLCSPFQAEPIPVCLPASQTRLGGWGAHKRQKEKDAALQPELLRTESGSTRIQVGIWEVSWLSEGAGRLILGV